MTFESEQKPIEPEKGSDSGSNGDPNISVDGVVIFKGGTERPPEEIEGESAAEIPSIESQITSGGWKAEWDKKQEEKNDQLYGDGQNVVEQMKKLEREADERRKKGTSPSN